METYSRIYLAFNDFKALERVICQNITDKPLEAVNILGIVKETLGATACVQTFQLSISASIECLIDGERVALESYGYDIVRGRITLTIDCVEYEVRCLDGTLVTTEVD